MKLTDQLNRPIVTEKTPRRIVCLVPSLTELLIDLGLEDKLVGVTKFCVHPKNLRTQKTVVGGTKTVHFDKLSALKPDIILCNKEENTPEIVKNCEKIAPVHVCDIKKMEDVYALLLQYGQLFDVVEKAADFIEKIKEKVSKFHDSVTNVSTLNVAYLIWRKPYMAAGDDTFINFLLKLNGFENIFGKKEGRYPEIQPEELSAAQLVLLSSEPFPFKQKHIDELKNHTKAKIMLVDGEYFSWYGSRLLGAFDYFEKLQNQI